jgi:thioredoxin-related protein
MLFLKRQLNTREEIKRIMNLNIFDPNRDPFADMKQALDYAKVSKKNILIEVGGDWCKWCHILENFITQHRELYEIRSINFVHVKVFADEKDSTNFDFFRKLPPIEAIPHLFVYDPNGNFLHSQPTEPLEEGESYNYDKIFSFLSQWGYKTPKNELM